MIQAGGAQCGKDRLEPLPGAAREAESHPVYVGQSVKGGEGELASDCVLCELGGVGTRERRNRKWNGQPWRRMQRSDYKKSYV